MKRILFAGFALALAFVFANDAKVSLHAQSMTADQITKLCQDVSAIATAAPKVTQVFDGSASKAALSTIQSKTADMQALCAAATAPPATAPTVSAPVASGTLVAPASVTLTVTASTATGTISKVEFFNGSTSIGVDTASPYSVSWTGVAAGTYSVTAVATNSANLSTTSAATSVVVSSPAPTLCTDPSATNAGQPLPCVYPPPPPPPPTTCADPAATNVGQPLPCTYPTSGGFSVSGVTLSGTAATVHGSGFGSGPSGVQSLNANIEAGSVGSNLSASGWAIKETDASNPVVYANDSVHSGSKALKVSVNPSSMWNGDFTAHLTTPLKSGGDLYVTWWVKDTASGGQWKMLRLSSNYTVVDGSGEMVFFNWLNSSTSGPQFVVDPGTNNDQTFYPPSSVYPASDGAWYRMEVLAHASSGGKNGSVTITRSGSSLNTYSTPALSNAGPFNHVIWQNYLGNGFPNGTLYFDDVNVQSGQARVELCDASTWSARKHCEFQPVTSWTDSSVSVSFSRGSFPSGTTAYVYVIDSAGNVTPGASVPLP